MAKAKRKRSARSRKKTTKQNFILSSWASYTPAEAERWAVAQMHMAAAKLQVEAAKEQAKPATSTTPASTTEPRPTPAGLPVERPAATASSPPPWGRERKLGPRERAKLMIADRKLFPKGTTGYSSIKAVHRELLQHCEAHDIKPWGDDTTGRAMHELK